MHLSCFNVLSIVIHVEVVITTGLDGHYPVQRVMAIGQIGQARMPGNDLWLLGTNWTGTHARQRLATLLSS